MLWAPEPATRAWTPTVTGRIPLAVKEKLAEILRAEDLNFRVVTRRVREVHEVRAFLQLALARACRRLESVSGASRTRVGPVVAGVWAARPLLWRWSGRAPLPKSMPRTPFRERAVEILEELLAQQRDWPSGPPLQRLRRKATARARAAFVAFGKQPEPLPKGWFVLAEERARLRRRQW